MLAASAPCVNEALVWPPCTPPVEKLDCWRTSATLWKPRIGMSSAEITMTGVAVSICVWGISEPVTITRSRVVTCQCRPRRDTKR